MKDVITKSSSLDFVLLVFGLLGASIQRLYCMSFYHAMPCKRSAKCATLRLPCREKGERLDEKDSWETPEVRTGWQTLQVILAKIDDEASHCFKYFILSDSFLSRPFAPQ
jgi:hypothetical protein